MDGRPPRRLAPGGGSTPPRCPRCWSGSAGASRACDGPRAIVPPSMPGWDDFPVAETLQSRFGVEVVVDNDVNIMAWGEYTALGAIRLPTSSSSRSPTQVSAAASSHRAGSTMEHRDRQAPLVTYASPATRPLFAAAGIPVVSVPRWAAGHLLRGFVALAIASLMARRSPNWLWQGTSTRSKKSAPVDGLSARFSLGS